LVSSFFLPSFSFTPPYAFSDSGDSLFFSPAASLSAPELAVKNGFPRFFAFFFTPLKA
jgi:hypothetical protein